MSAEILSFPSQEPRLRVVPCESTNYQMRNLTDAADYAGAIASEVTSAAIRLAAGARLPETERIIAGGTLEDALNAVRCLIRVRGTNEDKQLLHAIINWLEANGSGEN